MFINLINKLDNIRYQLSVKRVWTHVRIESNVLKTLQGQLQSQLQPPTKTPSFTTEEQAIIHQILQTTERQNRNNITRTEAYRQIYLRTPELHWAFLAHMVSRNGGWSMTDLKGDLLHHLLSDEIADHFFSFFERCNALIFQDAYPQLLLYEESVKNNRNLSHLLDAFHVSKFMKPFWDDFWLRKDPRLVTIALIINEQTYIEKRVIQNPKFTQQVFRTSDFLMQSLAHLTQVVFPFYPQTYKGNKPIPRLAGVIVESFTDLNERIGVGKALYSILFGIPEVCKGTREFAEQTPHTGSRSDFWPDIFTHDSPKRFELFKERLLAGHLKKGAPKYYSPRLENAWPDRPVEAPERTDWFTDMQAFAYLRPYSVPFWFDMTQEYCQGINKMELAVLSKQLLEQAF